MRAASRTGRTCVYLACSPPSLPCQNAPVAQNTVSAGTLTIVGGELDSGQVLTPDAGYGYLSESPQGPETFFLIDDTLTVIGL